METSGNTSAREQFPWQGIGCITIPFLALAAVPLAWGGRARWSEGALLRHGVIVQGRVTELRYVPGNPSMTRSGRNRSRALGDSPVFEFTTRTGVTLTAVGSMNRKPPAFAVGEVVEVAYDPADPRRANVVRELQHWRFWFVVWCSIATALAAVSLAPILLWRRQLRRQVTGVP